MSCLARSLSLLRRASRVVVGVLLVALCGLAVPAFAQQSSFVLRVDRNQIPQDDSFVCEVTLSFEGDRAENYKPPDFKGFRVLGEHPSQSTQIQMGGGGIFRQTVYSWRYELAPLKQGNFTLGPARVKVQGRELRTDTMTVAIGAPLGQARAQAAPRGRRGASPFSALGIDPFADEPEPAAPPSSSSGDGSFLRASAEKTRVYLGEPLAVDWEVFLSERQDKIQTVTEPGTDGFWSEDLPGTSVAQGNISLSQKNHEGRTYLTAVLLRKALFPLRPGKLTITPMVCEIGQVDFFGRGLRSQRLSAAPLTVEVLPLPTEGQPAGFDPTAVGQFTINASVDRNSVNVGDAVTLTVTVSGRGNLHKLQVPRLPALAGWKAYEPKQDVKLEGGASVSGRKTIEHLLLPERPGTTMIPAFELAAFDPEKAAYVTVRSEPIRLEVAGAAVPVAAAAGSGGLAPQAAAGSENVLPTEIRPPRARATLRRDLGVTFFGSNLFWGFLILPPAALLLTSIVGRVRQQLGRDTVRGRRRKLQRLVRRYLGEAEEHLSAGRIGPCLVEIDRTLRELLSSRFAVAVAGLSRDELAATLKARGVPETLVTDVLGLLDECDRGRFAPGSVRPEDARSALDRADKFIFELDKAHTVAVDVPR